MVMALFLLLVLFFVTAHGFMNCSTAHKHDLSQSSSIFINTKKAALDQIVVLESADNSVSKDLVWRGNRNGLDISLYESESVTQSMRMRPTMQGSKVSLEIVLKKMKGGSFHDIKEKIQTAFDAGTVSQECQVPTAIQSYAGDNNIPNWMKCFACATVLGFTVPVVLNIAIGDLFTAWCISQGQSEEQCEVWSMDVVLASEGAIILIGGAIVYEVCFSGGKCESQLEPNNMLKL